MRSHLLVSVAGHVSTGSSEGLLVIWPKTSTEKPTPQSWDTEVKPRSRLYQLRIDTPQGQRYDANYYGKSSYLDVASGIPHSGFRAGSRIAYQ
ncbi:uncharacterized protein METZ01_LOCUS221313, partial [marine metagenome]